MPGPDRKRSLASWIQGTWSLESFTSTDSEGTVAHVMGTNVRGYISYTADGWMSVQISAADRKPYDAPDLSGGTNEQLTAAAATYFAYAGRYTLVPQTGVVIHHLQFSLLPNWVGGEQKRYIERVDEDRLVLSGDPALLNGKQQVARLRWQRAKTVN